MIGLMLGPEMAKRYGGTPERDTRHLQTKRSSLDAQVVESALKDGITDTRGMGELGVLSYESHYSVKLNDKVTKANLIAFISTARPCPDLEAFFNARDAGLITLTHDAK